MNQDEMSQNESDRNGFDYDDANFIKDMSRKIITFRDDFARYLIGNPNQIDKILKELCMQYAINGWTISVPFLRGVGHRGFAPCCHVIDIEEYCKELKKILIESV